MNIEFSYMYRDSSNYKNYDSIIIDNPSRLDEKDLKVVAESFQKILTDGKFFIAEKADLKDLHFKEHDEDLDHDWHEFVSLDLTNDPVNDLRSLSDLMKNIKAASS